MSARKASSPKLRRAVFLALAAASPWSAPSVAGTPPTPLPVPCSTGTCANGPSQFVTLGTASAASTAKTMTITQGSSSAILNWSSFNIAAGNSVVFNQPSASSIALNRIFVAPGAQAAPSQIFGNLTANGQVYLINLNGFLFGSTATVNVGGLLVSSLPMTLSDANFKNGILSPLQNDKPIFDSSADPYAANGVGRSVVLDANGNPVLDANGNTTPVGVVVQPGAQITAADQGRILLAGQNVTNGGTLTAPDGQVILAAGQKVYLQADTDPSLRGLIVEVDQGGTAWNQLSGAISSPRGNVTMVGLAVNQDGRISATTSVSANGSIWLEAADTAAFGGSVGNQTVASSHGGTLTIGPQSDMEILPELASSATEVPAQAQLPSAVTLLGEQVIVQGGNIVAPGGTLTAIAAADPALAAASPAGGVSATLDPNARLRIDPGTTIDLSGSDATLPMAANLVEAQLRSNELADDPSQRNGALHGLTVYIDARQGSPLIANLSGEIAAVPQNVAQRTENGGSAILESQGDVVFASGASLNVSGGATTYQGGVLQTSYLVGANGLLYPIATASPLMTYVGVVNPTFSQSFNKWGVQQVVPTPGLSSYQAGYVQGAAAGSVQFVAPTMVLGGTLTGTAVNGPYQRTPATAVAGGQLIIGLPGGAGNSALSPPIDYLAPAVQISATPAAVSVADSTSLPAGLALALPASYLTGSGFTSTQIYSDYGVTLPAGLPLTLPAGSTLSVNAARVDVLSSIADPGGTLAFQNVYNVGSVLSNAPRPGVYIGDDVTLDVRGQWTNDTVAAGAPALLPTWQNGGTIAIGATSPGALVSLGTDVTLRASGGAWLQANGTPTPGKGGSIAINDNAPDGGLDVGSNLAVEGFGVNGAAGGSFSLSAPRIEVSNGSGPGWTIAQQVDDSVAPGGVFQVYAGLFSNYGFGKIALGATGLVAPGATTTSVLTVDPGTTIDATVSSLALGANAPVQPSAANVGGFATPTLLAPYLRPAASITLTAVPPASGSQPAQIGTTTVGDLTIGQGAAITTDAGGSIALTSLDSILVDGALTAPGGTIALHILSPSASGSPYGSYEAGFLPNQRIELGSDATIDVSGTFVPQPSTTGVNLGTVYAGGTASLLADRGAVVTDPGSLIAAAGASGALDVLQPNGAYAAEVAASAAGSITVRSGESISLLGAIAAAAGSGSSGPAAAGSLDVELTRSQSWWSSGPNAAYVTSFGQTPMTVVLAPTTAGNAPEAFNSDLAILGVAQLAASGIDALRVVAGDSIQLNGNVSLGLARELLLDAPAVAAIDGTNATLAAPYVQVGYGVNLANTKTASGGSASVSFSGGEIDLVGSVVFQGTSSVSFTSSGDIVLRGEPTGTGAYTLVGGLTVAGALNLDAERIYPVTATSFALTATEPASGTSSSVTIGSTGGAGGAPLSAGGALSIAADTIASTGAIYVPFGTIALDAAKSVTLGDGSLTSVSGAGLTIPYGATQYNASEWVYQPGSGLETISGVPSRAVSLQAPSVSITKNATIDLTGGGDLAAFEFVPGPGGSQDALAAGVVPGLYAILPSTAGHAAPQDPEYSAGSTIQPGESIVWTGGGGLAAGTYPLLPARYGLVPGAFLVQLEPSFQSTTPGQIGALGNGTPVVAGFLSYGSTGLHQTPGYTGFAIYPGSYGQQLASYTESLASSYFSAAAAAAGAPRPVLPADAGSLEIAVGAALDATGQVLTSAAAGGRGAAISISANDLVVGSASGTVPGDAVTVSGAVLSSWQPGSLLLGGSMTADGGTIDVLANTVTVGAGTTLTAGQIVVVAGQSVDVQNGATLQSTSATGSTPVAPLPAAQTVALAGAGNGSAALLAVSDLNWIIAARPAGAPPPGAGTVAVDAGATVASRGALSIDGPGGVTLAGTLTGPGAAWSLGAGSIAIVPSGASSDALAIGPALLAQLEGAGAVRLASSGALDLLTPTTLGVDANGNPTLGSLTLVAATINNLTGAKGTAGATGSQFGAETLVLEGAGTGGTATAGPAGASLALVAGQLEVGPGALAINGFASTHATASAIVTGQGTGGVTIGGDLAITAPAVTAGPAAQTSIAASGALTVAAPAGGASTAALPLGGELTLSGGSVEISGLVAAKAGILDVQSTGNLTLDSGATVTAAGALVTVGNQTIGTPGGTVALSAGGNLALASGATLDVSGSGAAQAGTLALVAGRQANVAATLAGNGGTGAAGGSFALDAGALAAAGGGAANPLTGIAAALAAGGFSNSIDLRVRGGDLTLAAGSTLAANTVEIAADTGHVLIDGDVSAPSGALRGSLAIFGGGGVELGAGGALHADGPGAAGLGGTIEIGAGQLIAGAGVLNAYNGAAISLDAGSTISAAGPAGAGTLLLRAPALVSSGDVAITSLASDVHAVGEVVVEPVLVFNTASFANPAAPTAADLQGVQGAVGTYMAGAGGTIATRLSHAGGTPFAVEAGVELVAAGPLTLAAAGGGSAAALNLASWRFGGMPVDLTVRAGGDLTVANTITDGFGTAQVGNARVPVLLGGASSSIRLVAGADLGSADPLAIVAGGAGALTLDAGAVVRSGTGDVDLIAAGDIVLAGPGAAAYTAGVPAVAPGGTASNPYPGVPSTFGTAWSFGVQLPRTSTVMSFPTGGGNLVVDAGGDILVAANGSAGGVTIWQIHEGGGSYKPTGATTSAPIPASWGVNLAAFDWNFATLGGGDLRIAAGGNATNVSAAAADSLLPQWGGGVEYVPSGGLSFTAGNNIASTQVFIADGAGSVRAGGALTAVLPSVSPTPGDAPIGSGFYLQDSSLVVTARLGAAVDGIFDPTAFGQIAVPSKLGSSYFSYGDGSSFTVETVTGDVVLGASSFAEQTLQTTAEISAAGAVGANVLPATVTIEAPAGGVRVGQGFDGGQPIMYPSAQGELDVVAGKDITGGYIAMSDAPAGVLPTVATPAGQTSIGSTAFDGNIHGQDPAPVLVTAGGSIDGLTLSLPKAAQIVAGQDIVDLSYFGQNLAASDLTLISAGRDFVYSNSYSGNGISVGGPGQLDILAGRNVSLGFSNGVVTTGNLLNPNLPTSQGADLTVVTGLATAQDVSALLTNIVAPSSTYQAQLVSYVESLQGSAGLSFAQAAAAFLALPTASQQPLVDQVFFGELQASGRAAVTTGGYAQGYAAIDALLPGSRAASATPVAGAYAGDLTLSFSRIYTLSGGNITLLVPGGLINVGVAVPPPLLAGRSASTLGIVAEGPGNVDIYAQGDVDVNSSRIFTLGGGSILIWSDQGSIDAGRGAKSAISAPPPAVLINSDGTVTVDFSGAAAGSGIRTIQTDPNVPLGDVDLFAPLGTVNAGDAGIGAAGNIFIGAQHVLGLDNIQFGGTASGVPAQVTSLGASLSGVSNAATSSTSAATSSATSGEEREKAAAPLAQAALGWLDVFVTGLGEEACKPDDLECLRRQKHE
jgi:filamentous hemagglutinin family protein